MGSSIVKRKSGVEGCVVAATEREGGRLHAQVTSFPHLYADILSTLRKFINIVSCPSPPSLDQTNLSTMVDSKRQLVSL